MLDRRKQEDNLYENKVLNGDNKEDNLHEVKN